MIFFKKKVISYKGYNVPLNEAYRISLSNRLLTFALMIVSGLALSSAFPPLNWELLAFVSVAPLIVQAIKNPVSWRLFFYGYVWSMSWSFCAFFWLREINPAIPFGISGIIGLWGGVYALWVSFVWRWSLRGRDFMLQGAKAREVDNLNAWQSIVFVISCGALFVMLEYIRIQMFPWNFIGVTQYKMLELIQIVKWTGIYGVSFLVVGMNAALALVIWYLLEKFRSKEVKFRGAAAAAGFMLILIVLSVIYGFFARSNAEKSYQAGRKVRFGIVQGDISQRRVSTAEMAKEALDTYMKMSYELAPQQPDIIIWPETAVPYPYFGGHIVSAYFRRDVYVFAVKTKIPLLLGTLDFVNVSGDDYDMTNSAFLISKDGRVAARYAKINRVPYGEFVPFREFLSDELAEKFGMGRDLRAGDDPTPLEVLPGVRAGMAICYESIFASLARNEANLGANILIAINNDAWYPESSEPEQHAANAVFRAIETGLPALRSGNNGASVLILPSGRIGWMIGKRDLLARERVSGVAEVLVQDRPEKTFYTRFGDVFLFVLFGYGVAVLLTGICCYFAVLRHLEHDEIEQI